MQLSFLLNTALFCGMAQEEVEALLGCLGSRTRQYEKGGTIYHVGQTITEIGLVLSGGVIIESGDFWGNNSVLGYVEAGQLFGETYACIPGEPLMVQVSACEKSEVLFLSVSRLFEACPRACGRHTKLIMNLAQIFARKNLGLSRRILHTSPKSVRGRLLSYLSEQAKLNGNCRFTIPYNRQQLADYLGVNRSAMSGELSKMREEGALDYKKNVFVLRQTKLQSEAGIRV